MKNLICFLMMLMAMPMMLFAQGGATTGFVLDFSTYAGLAAIISLVVTQLSNWIPYVKEHGWLKIIISVVVGIIVAVAVKGIGLNSPVVDLAWGMTVLAGALTGLAASGLYDLARAIGNLFKKKEDNL